MSEAAAFEMALPVVPLDAAWQEALKALPIALHDCPEDPLSPFIAWLMSRHRVPHDQALKVANTVRTLHKQYPIEEVLHGDPRDLAERIPGIDARKHVGGGRSQHGKKFRQAGYRFQEWAAVRGMA